jgi:tetratricopeptide (TPR) repeat protein
MAADGRFNINPGSQPGKRSTKGDVSVKKNTWIWIAIGLGAAAFAVIAVFKTSVETQTKSVHRLALEGIRASRSGKVEIALDRFDRAIRLLGERGYALSPKDVPEVASLINEFKTGGAPRYETLLALLPDSVVEQIEALKHSRDIDRELVEALVAGVNSLIESPDVIERLGGRSLETGFSEKAKRRIRKAREELENAAEGTSGKINARGYIHRIYLAELYPPYFPFPVRQSDLVLNKALALRERKKFEVSNAFLQTILEKDPGYVNAYLLSAKNHESGGRLDEAVEVLERGIRNLPDEEKLYAELAYFYDKTGKKNRAEELLNRALELNPEYENALESLRSIERKQKNALKDPSHYRARLEKNPGDLNLESNLALALLKEKKIAASEKVVDRGLSRYPEDPFLLKLKGWILGARKEYREAVSSLLLAKRKSEEPDPQVYLLLGITYFNQFLNADALGVLEEGIETFPDDPYLVLNMAEVCEQTPSRRDEAVKWYRKYLDLRPNAGNRFRVEKKIRELSEPSRE